MHEVYTCLVQQHDPGLVIIAGLVCLLASWTALGLARRGTRASGFARSGWLATAAIVAGCGIWATHFVGMLAFSAGLPVGYGLAPTVLSIVAAIAISGMGLAIAAETAPWRLWAAGAVIGFGTAVMHFTGMAALRVPALVSWDPWLVTVAVLLGLALASLAIRAALGETGAAGLVIGTVLLTLAICALHFTAMAALRLEPSPLAAIPGNQPSPWWLASGVAAAFGVILVSATTGLVVDNYLAGRTAREAARLRALVDATFEGIVIHAEGPILDLNTSFAALLGYSEEELLGRSLLDLMTPPCIEQARAHLAAGGIVAWEADLIRADGSHVPVELFGRPIEYNGRRARVVAVRDLSERRLAEDHIRYLAHHDALTGLPNRVLLADRLRQALAHARRHGNSTVAVLCLDLDHFKQVNDTLGHPVGDMLLAGVAERLLASIREADTVARLGGDEFAIIQAGLEQPAGAGALAQRVIEVLSAPYEAAGHQLVVGASVGIAIAPDDGTDPDDLLKKADMALYRAKADGRGTFRSFEPEMDAKLQERRLLELDLRKALPAGELELHYQPVLELQSNEITSFEALLRWRHPVRGMVTPDEFIPLAEEIALIVPIGEWVLHRACADAASWPGEVRVAVNLSTIQFRRGQLVTTVVAALAASGLRPDRLELEITETVLLEDNEATLAILRDLRELGVRISMDDFGTGYSSLGYLRSFPFDKIKIDRSFVRDLGASRDCEAIVRAVTGLGGSLGMATTAEGVETWEQLQQLRAEGCSEAQGFYISPPMPVEEVVKLMSATAGSSARAAARRNLRAVG